MCSGDMSNYRWPTRRRVAGFIRLNNECPIVGLIFRSSSL